MSAKIDFGPRENSSRQIAADNGIEILDEGGRLPADAAERLQNSTRGVLYVPDRGVPIHEDSFARIIKTMAQTEPTHLDPHIPVATELGLPKYEPLAYWCPGKTATSRGLLSRLWNRNFRLDSTAFAPDEDNSTALIETTPEEQVHYFATNFPVLCPQPIQVSPVVSNSCNLKCIMCPYHSPDIRPKHTTGFFDEKSQMSWETMMRIAEECGERKIGLKVGNIEEPLLHPRMIDFVREARKRGVPSFHITSNGLPLDEARLNELYDAGLTSLYISVDAARHDTYKRVRGASLDKVQANIRMAVRIRDERNVPCTVRTSFVKNKGVSLEEVDEFRERWVAEADGVILYNLAEYEDGNSHFDEVNEFVQERMKSAQVRWPCLNPFQEIYVLPDSRVYYCCETVSKLAFETLPSNGDYERQSLTDIWIGESFTKLRKDLILNQLSDWSACIDCGIWMAHAMKVTEADDRITTQNMITEIVDRKK